MSARTYKMTISTAWDEEHRKTPEEQEMYFTTSRRGDIRRVRRSLARRGLQYFQRHLYRKHRRWIPKKYIRISFERERPATKTQRHLTIEALRMERKGRRWKAYRLPSRVISYVKKRYRRRTRR